CGAGDQLGDIGFIARHEFDRGLARAHDDGERALVRVGDEHLPLELRLVAIDHDLERLTAANMYNFDWTLQLLIPGVERAGCKWQAGALEHNTVAWQPHAP